MAHTRLDWIPVGKDVVAVLSLNRPQVSNAFNAEVIEECLVHFTHVREKGHACRAFLIRGEGKHFSGGADLEWMKKSAHMGEADNRRDAERLSGLFSKLSELPMPTIAVVHGASFGGALGVIAACDWAIAADDARFCLSEVRVGVLPAVILPYLARKMMAGDLRRWMLSARLVSAEEARHAGLIQRVVKAADLDAAVREEVGLILLGEPEAQRVAKQLHLSLLDDPKELWETHRLQTVAALTRARCGAAGQEGLSAFLNKQTPGWARLLPPDWKFH